MTAAMIIVNDSDTFMDQIDARDNALKALPKPEPFRLVMIKCQDFCQFCENPKGGVYNHYINFDYKIGFLSCEKCNNKANDAVEEWFATEAWGDANFLRNKNIKIKRSSGDIESNWKLDKEKPFVEMIKGSKAVHCIKDDGLISKYCLISDLLELNKEQLEINSTTNPKELNELLKNTKLL